MGVALAVCPKSENPIKVALTPHKVIHGEAVYRLSFIGWLLCIVLIGDVYKFERGIPE